MIANILTKPVQGSQLMRERRLLTNWPEEGKEVEPEPNKSKDDK